MDATNTVMVGGEAVRVSKFHSLANALAYAVRANGTRKQNARGPGGAQRVVLGDVDDEWGPYWVADCNRSAGKLVNAGYEYEGV